MSIINNTPSESYIKLGRISGEERFHRDLEALNNLGLEWSKPTAHHPYVRDYESAKSLLGEGKIGSVYEYTTAEGIRRAYKVIRPRDVPGFDSITAATDLRLSDFILDADQANRKVQAQTSRLSREGYGHITYPELKKSYEPCQNINIGSLLQWLPKRAQFMQLGDTSKLQEDLTKRIVGHRGGLVSLINDIAYSLNRSYVANHLTRVQAEQYATYYGLPISSIRTQQTEQNGHPLTVYQVPLLPFSKVFPDHVMTGINDEKQWFTVMELLKPSMGDTMQDVAKAFEKAASGNGQVDVAGIMRKVENTFNFDHLKTTSLMLDFIHILGLTLSDLKPDNITFDQQGNLLLADLSAMQKIGTPRLYGSPKYMTPGSLEDASNDKLVGRAEDDHYALNQIKLEWEEFLKTIPELTNRATMQKYMQGQQERKSDSEHMTMELINRGRK